MLKIVSVIIAAFNAAKTIEDSILSVIRQSYSAVEIIVVDDGSTDNTKEVVFKYPQVKYFYQENAGPAKARNLGVNLCSGEYICFLDADDTYEPERLKILTKILEENKDIQIVCSSYFDVTEKEKVVYPKFRKMPEKGCGKKINYLYFATRSSGHVASTWNFLMKKEIFLSIGGFNEELRNFEDPELHLRLAQTHQYYFINIPLVSYRHINDNSLSKQKSLPSAFLEIIMRNSKMFGDNYYNRDYLNGIIKSQDLIQQYGYLIKFVPNKRWCGLMMKRFLKK